MKTILIIGATGAQGGATLKHLSATGEYQILALTRSATSPQAKDLDSLPNVKLITNNAASGYDTEAFLSAASTSDYVFVNTDGFTLGEQAETFWGIRLFELAVRAGVKHFIYSGLDNSSKKSGYDPKFYTGHYEGKARVQGRPLSLTIWQIVAHLNIRLDSRSKRLPDGMDCHQVWPIHRTSPGCDGTLHTRRRNLDVPSSPRRGSDSLYPSGRFREIRALGVLKSPEVESS